MIGQSYAVISIVVFVGLVGLVGVTSAGSASAKASSQDTNTVARARALEAAQQAGIPCRYVGRVGGDSICVGDKWGGDACFADIPLADLRAAHEGFFPALMQGEL